MKHLTHKQNCAALIKAVHPIKLTPVEQARLYRLAMQHKGNPGWTK